LHQDKNIKAGRISVRDKEIEINPLTRVEGDLKIRVILKDGKVSNAYASGVMFRGIESILQGRDPMDPIVITPRICGICGTSHLTCAVQALDSIYAAKIPRNARLIRNICLAIESVMSSLTHLYFMFLPDLLNKKYASIHGYSGLRRFAPIEGSSYIAALRERKRLLEIIAIFSGQWPHSHFMVPGGVACTPTLSNITKALTILANFQRYLEERVYGCKLEEWLNSKYSELTENYSSNSDFALFDETARQLKFVTLGRGCGKFLSFGGYPQTKRNKPLLKGGFYDGKKYHKLRKDKITEHVKYSWYKDYQGGKYPYQGETQPQIEDGGAKYSWSKAPRYANEAVEVGPLARHLVNKDPFILQIYKNKGPNVYTRMMARFYEIAKLMPLIRSWLEEIDTSRPFYNKPTSCKDGKGFGLIEAPRGALGHWSIIENEKIKNYQVITPTTWNASPRDSTGTPGPMEQALIGTPVLDENNPVEILHVVRSFDPCLVCTVHAVKGKFFRYDYHK
jgi:hydrogenase large subunit